MTLSRAENRSVPRSIPRSVLRTIHWFRRDLRLTDNTALLHASQRGENVIPVYIVSEWKSTHRWTGEPRQRFLCGCLDSLSRNLERGGGRLLIRAGDAVEELLRLAEETGASAIYCNRDPDPFGRATELRLAVACRERNIAFHALKDHALHEREEALTATGEPYRVFTPYARTWAGLTKAAPAGKLPRIQTPSEIASLPLPSLATWRLGGQTDIVEPGEHAARKRMDHFFAGTIFDYSDLRDVPGTAGTSRLSQDLRHGLVSIREVYARCIAATRDADARGRKGVEKFIGELAWREFYFQILWHFPEVLDREFNAKHRGLPWVQAGEHFERWKTGTTGFPIVDAAMRELAATGYMHNRARMIAAMFLTKDLHLDWRLGESWFMQRLVDGEIASNNGGWQWSAGTGADAAPYFRIQNPWTQTARHDPDGKYIHRWVPELRDVSPSTLARCPDPGQSVARGYPAPVVDHARERDVTLAMFR